MEKKLPKNWLSIPFTDIFDINGGTQPPKSVFIDEHKEGYIRLLQIRDFGSKPVPTYIPDTGKLMTCKKDDILIARYGASIGRIVTGMEGSYNVALAKVSIPESINKNFVKWLLKSNIFQEPILSIQRTAQNGFNKTDLASIYIPLPPQVEQNRIVTKLDALFAQLETIKTSMAKVPLLLKDFRQQVLTQAVTGKLTGVKTKVENLGGLLSDVKYGTSKKSDYETEGIPIFRIPNINNGEISDEDLKFSILDKKEENQLKLKKGDILLIRSNGSVSIVGQSAIIRDKHVGYSYAGYLIRLRCKEDLLPEYLNYSLKSNFLRLQIVEKARSTSGVNNINSQEIKDLEIMWCSPKEQQEIVSRVESLFAKADAIEKQYETLKAKIESLPQAILHKAFKGELTQQLDSDGDARELLKEIEGLKEVGKTLKSKKTKLVAKKV